jgi:hypothetical protein
MSSEVAIPEARLERFEASLAAEEAAERGLWITITKTILISLPIMVGVLVLMTAIAISDKTDWYVWLSMGVGLGVIGACLLGSLAGAPISAHPLGAGGRPPEDR